MLRGILNEAVERRLLVWNPTTPVKVATPERPKVTVWDVKEAETFLDHARQADPRLWPAYLLALRCGLRRGEILALRWEDVDLDGRRLSVRRNAVQVGDETIVGEPKSKQGVRTLPLDDDTAAELRQHRTTQRRERLAAETWQDSDLVVCDDGGRMLPPWLLTARFRELAAEAGLTPIHLHAARHSAGTAWREAGVEYKIIQEWMGHSALSMTMDLYSHVRPQISEAAAEQVAAYRRASR